MERSDLVGPVVVHCDDTIRYANGEFCSLVGAEAPSDLVGSSLTEFVAEPYRDELTERFDRLERGDDPVHGLALELVDVDGRDAWEAMAMSSLVDWDGETRIHTSFMTVAASTGLATPSLHESALMNSPVGVTIADATRPDEPLIYVNDAFEELTGYSREAAVGRNCRFLQGEATRDEPVAELRAAIDEGRATTVELRNYRKDGSLFWNRVTVQPVKDDGTVTHFLGFQEDVSDAKVYAHERTLFGTHSEMSEQAMFITDIEGTIEYVNPAFERATGYSAAEAIGNTPQILYSGEQDDEFYEEMWDTITTGETWEEEITNRTKSGELYRVAQKIVPIADNRGEITHFAAIEPDVTDERLTQQALEVLNRILRHNVRTSINVIDGYVDLLETGLDESERRRALETIRERTAALNEISERTTALRSLFEGREESTPLELSAIETIVDRYRKVYRDATFEVRIEVDGDHRIRNGQVFQVALDELVKNAVIHNDREHPAVGITVSRSTNEDNIVVEVRDDGPGIPESEWEVIRRGAETPLNHADSIGLWLMYWSMTALGGSVDYSPNDPRGSVLTLEVPSLSGAAGEGSPSGS